MHSHTCHAFGCDRVIAPRFFMCPRHWAMVPPRHKAAVLRTYRPGQEIDKSPSPEYVAAATAARNAVRDLEGNGNA